MHLELQRYKPNSICVMGNLRIKDIEHDPIYTLENPWLDNKPWVSCIPAGDYAIEHHISPRFGDCLKIFEVDGRSDILIHAGNTESDTSGCILVGLGCGEVNGEQAVLSSKAALIQLLFLLKDVKKMTISIIGDEIC